MHEVAAGDEPSDDELNHPDAERRSDLRKARHKRENERCRRPSTTSLPEVFAAVREASSGRSACATTTSS